jgi:peptidylprolyl isomerase
VSNQKRRRQSANRAARAQQQRRDATRRQWVKVGVIAVVVAMVVGTLAVFLAGEDGGDGSGQDSATTRATAATTTTVAALPSAAGKPCVAVADPLPAGAPAVPVREGPPPTTLVTQDLKEGTGAAAAATSTVTVDYVAVSCSTGKIFDSSYSRGQPDTYQLDRVIPGWSQGLAGMKVGGQRLIGIPPDLAYGSAGGPPDIAPDETLWFLVDLRAVQAPAG